MAAELGSLLGLADSSNKKTAGLISGISEIFAGNQDEKAAREIAKKQEEAIISGQGEYGTAFEDISSRLMPYMEGGGEAFGQYQDLDMSYMPQNFEYSQTIGDFLDPSMGFQIEQSMRPIESSAAAGGSLGSGATLKALQDRGQKVASLNYGQAYDRMANDKSFAYKNYLNRANMQRQQNLDRGNQLQNLFNTGYNATQGYNTARDNLGTRNANAYFQAANIPSSAAIGYQANANMIRKLTDPAVIGSFMPSMNSQMLGGMGGQQPQMQTQQTPYTGMGSTNYQPPSPTDWFNPRGGNV